jgi:hypothetical protein
MISSRLYNFRFDIFGNVFQFILLPIVKGHNLLWVILGCYSHFVLFMWAYFNILLQNLFHFFFHTYCRHYWHIVNDHKKVVIYELFRFFIFICQTTTIISLRFILVESNNFNQYLCK